jgi:hypothetical protein
MRGLQRVGVAAAIALTCTVLTTSAVAAATWHFEDFDGASPAEGRTANDVGASTAEVMYQGVPHVFYFDRTDFALRHAWKRGPLIGNLWAFETLDGNGGPNGRTAEPLTFPISATLYQGVPHVFYGEQGGDLHHAWWNASIGQWQFEILDGAGGPNGRTEDSLGFADAVAIYDGVPHVWYFDNTGGDLRHAWWNASAGQWGFEALDGNGGPDGRTTNGVGIRTAVTLYENGPHVFYIEAGGILRHAWWNAAARQWGFESLDGLGGPNGRTDDSVIVSNGVTLYGGAPHVWYRDIDAGTLRHAWWDAGALQWRFETLDGEGGANGRVVSEVGDYASVVIFGGTPHVFYKDFDAGSLRHAWWNAGIAQWAFEDLDGGGVGIGETLDDVGLEPEAALVGDQLNVWYYDMTERDLIHAWYS